jgi:hypothetical protein
VRLENEDLAIAEETPPQQGLWDSDGNFEEEDVETEKGRQLPDGVDDPKKVSEEQLRPIRARAKPQTEING